MSEIDTAQQDQEQEALRGKQLREVLAFELFQIQLQAEKSSDPEQACDAQSMDTPEDLWRAQPMESIQRWRQAADDMCERLTEAGVRVTVSSRAALGKRVYAILTIPERPAYTL